MRSLAAGLALAGLPTLAGALPTGENVRHGDVSVSRPTTQSMQIEQRTAKGVVDWNGFSIAAGEHVNVSQPGASSVLLNRVVGASPSEIFGRLTANGQVFLTNPNGVLFAPGASVEVGALFATTLGISDADFLAGRYTFANGGGAGSVINRGSITTLNGYAALAAPQVVNEGTIVVQLGTAALAAGDRVTLDMVGDRLISVSVDQGALNASVVHGGTILADGGLILMSANGANSLLDGVINTTGVVRANTLAARQGEIVLEASKEITVAGAGMEATGSIAVTVGPVTMPIGGIATVTGGVKITENGIAFARTAADQAVPDANPSSGTQLVGAGISGIVLRDAQNRTVSFMPGSIQPLPPLRQEVHGAGISVPSGAIP
jgi:filamentous hemagglutinin family protein